MKPFDFNIHLVPKSTAVDGWITSEQGLDADRALECYQDVRSEARRLLSGVNIMLFNQSWSHQPELMKPLAAAAREDFGDRAVFTQLVDVRKAPAPTNLAMARQWGLRGIKFHPYVQKISEDDWPAALQWAEAAQRSHLFICIDGSYGTAGMYEYDNLRFAAWLATRITTVPIIILHSGGLRALEAWLLAASCPNVWLETSFSLPTYEGTRVEQDLYTAYHKLGGERVLYASDHPYISMQDSLTIFRRFVKHQKFTAAARDQMLFGSADQLLKVVA